MAGEWRDITLGDFVALQRGHDLTEPARRIGRVPVMGSAGQNGFHDTALSKGPGIVIGRSGASFGQVHFCKEDFRPHNTGLYVTDFKGNDPFFAFYFLKALDFDRFNSGSAQPSLNRNFIYPIPIRVPKPAEQKAIAAVLGALDDKIELNRRMNATLEAMARALFQSWFVDFDPVRAKLDGRPPPALTKPLPPSSPTPSKTPRPVTSRKVGPSNPSAMSSIASAAQRRAPPTQGFGKAVRTTGPHRRISPPSKRPSSSTPIASSPTLVLRRFPPACFLPARFCFPLAPPSVTSPSPPCPSR